MALTPLHLALGLEDDEFTFDLIQGAIEASVEETDALDWKKSLPHKQRHEEFAKDVAAMANSGGGMIVYGVTEAIGPSSAAGEITGVEGWGDSEERRLRHVNNTTVSGLGQVLGTVAMNLSGG